MGKQVGRSSSFPCANCKKEGTKSYYPPYDDQRITLNQTCKKAQTIFYYFPWLLTLNSPIAKDTEFSIRIIYVLFNFHRLRTETNKLIKENSLSRTHLGPPEIKLQIAD